MKKPWFIPPEDINTNPDIPDNLEDAKRLLARAHERNDSLKTQASQAQDTYDQGARLRLLRGIPYNIYFQNMPKRS